MSETNSNNVVVLNFERYIKKVKKIIANNKPLDSFFTSSDNEKFLSEHAINLINGSIKKLEENTAEDKSSNQISQEEEYKYFFRGQSNEKKNQGDKLHLTPSIFRDSFKNHEDEVYQYALRNFPHKLDDLSYFNQLATIQHFNAPTRLLDITSNPLVALYFALGKPDKEKNKKNQKKEENQKDDKKQKDPTVYVFKIPNKMISPISSDKVMILSALATRTNKEMEELKEATKEFIRVQKHCENINSGDSYIKQLNNWAFPKLIHEIQKKCPAFEHSIEPQDLILPRVVLAPKIEQRIIAQSGAFFVTGIELYENFNEDIINCFKVAEIKINSKNHDFSKYLDLFQIKEETLFPEMESALKALREKFEKK